MNMTLTEIEAEIPRKCKFRLQLELRRENHPRYPDNKLRYHGGHTRVLSVQRSISFAELAVKLGEVCGMKVSSLRCQLPADDLDALVTVSSDEDLANLMEEYDLAATALKIHVFLSPRFQPCRLLLPRTHQPLALALLRLRQL
ncbi:hypothetical protein Bca52824_014828 [Brassica carinata]|uniref:PB1 domain-containing protein n=1 Tax=Brassica carinata TaxID=52824 RepID=A0A8X7W3L2_BRACI|nr:hypothetical protein Bca52824_014828 [Brassica carinata]